MAVEDLDEMLNLRSGLAGICGKNDMRTITERAEQGDARSKLALEMFCYRIRKYIGSYTAVLGGADCIVFTGGIGENSPVVRQMSCTGLEHMGIVVDETENRTQADGIFGFHAADSSVKMLVVPTDEELEIAIQTLKVLNAKKGWKYD